MTINKKSDVIILNQGRSGSTLGAHVDRSGNVVTPAGDGSGR